MALGTGISERARDNLVDAIYATTTEQARWPELLDRMSEHLASRSCIYRWPRNDPAANNPMYDNLGDYSAPYREHYHTTNVWVTEAGRYFGAPMLRGEAILRDEDLDKTEFYNDFLRPQGLRYGVSCTVGSGRDMTYNLGLLREARAGAFDAEQRRLIGSLLPHLSRAITTAQMLGEMRGRSSGLTSALETLGLGVMIVDAGRRVRFVNAVAESLLVTTERLRINNGRLGAAPSGLDAELAGALDVACGGGRTTQGRGGRILSAPRRDAAVPLTLAVAPLDAREGDAFGVGPLALVLVSDPAPDLAVVSEGLRAVYDLTPAEARLTAALCAGQSLADYAALSGVGLSTVKTHLNAVFAKMGETRQSDVVRRVAANPLLRLPT